MKGLGSPGNPARRPLCAALGFALLLLFGTLGFTYSTRERAYPDPVPLRVSGLVGNSSGETHPVSPDEARGAEYLPASNVLRLPGGDLFYVPRDGDTPVNVPAEDPGALKSVRESRDWLNEGDIPGSDRREREVATRALLDLRLLTTPDGATIAAPTERWDYVWPRDASWASVAFAATGHYEESLSELEFLARVQDDDGRWEARYQPDGDAVLDGRGAQLDGGGWFLWAVWFHAQTSPEGAKSVAGLWPETKLAADAAARSLGRDGLPPGGSDYWEIQTLRPNLGTSAALLVGLRSAADLATDLGHEDDAVRYRAAASRLEAAVERDFAPNGSPTGYTRTPWPMSGRDSAVTFLGPPFAPEDRDLRREIDATASALTVPNGGVIPGERWPQEPTVSWTPETAFFMLSASASGDERRADEWFGWLAAHRTELGAFPEKVDADGSLKAAAPLAWTSAIVVISLAAEDGSLPAPPE